MRRNPLAIGLTIIAALWMLNCGAIIKQDVQRRNHEQQSEVEDADRARRSTYLDRHQDDLPWEVRDAIRQGKVLVGMSEGDVLASLGDPEDERTIETRSGRQELWIYEDDDLLNYMGYDSVRVMFDERWTVIEVEIEWED